MDTKNLKTVIETVKAMYQPKQIQEASMMKDDGKVTHNCAKHVEHAEWGQGNCIAEEHADPDRYGNIAWYDIEFPHGIEKGVPVSELKILQAEMHMHSKAKKKVAEAIEGDNSRNTENDKEKEKALEAAKAVATNTLPNEATPGVVAGAKVGGETEIVKQGVSEGKLNEEKYGHEVDVNKYEDHLHGEEGEYYDGLSDHEKDYEHLHHIMKKHGYKEGKHFSTTENGMHDHMLRSVDLVAPHHKEILKHPEIKHFLHHLEHGDANKPWDYKKHKLEEAKLVAGAVLKKVMAKEEVEEVVESVNKTVIYAPLSFEIQEADKGYDAYFRAYMKKHGISSVADFKTPEEKKAFFNKVDAGFKAKNEEVFLEAMMSKEMLDKIAAHEKGGHKVSDKQSKMKNGDMEYSFVVTRPDGKRSRHIYHGSSSKVQSMQGSN